MSNLPLNVPFLLSRICPDAQYVMNGRSYGDIVWLDKEARQPSLQDLENEFLKIQALESAVESKSQELVRKEKMNSHDVAQSARAKAAQELALTNAELQAELNRIKADAAADIEVQKNALLDAQKAANIENDKMLAEEKQKFLMEIARSDPAEHFEFIHNAVDGAKDTAMRTYRYAKNYLKATDWYVLRRAELDTPIPADVLKQRADARSTINQIISSVADVNADLADWKKKRISMHPSKEEIISALKLGGFAAKEMIKKIRLAQEKVPKPKKKDAWR